MNFFVETLNHWSGNFLSFTWPMFWQSSVLIAVLFAVDLLFRRKLRASIRYALWLVVLVKLCVPPTLALPTSPAWWLHRTPPPVVAKPLPRYTVTYDNGPLPEILPTSLAAVAPPRPVMTNAAWLLVISTVISSALLLWLLVRWWQITRMVRRATASERLAFISDEAQKIIGMKLKVQVKLTINSMSPAVCGLFRPVILIPQSLAENFSEEQLRAVLLHELIHLRRRDVWVNFVQALLQIVYWWHPLVWLANARIRRVREEAVDDAVMLALRDTAESYAPTLLEVAKLALNRPLASLGLVGILESRHALRQRIERLVDFRAPRRAGLTLVSLLGVLAFTAVAVPMGDKPAPAETPSAVATAADEDQSLTVKVDPELFIRNVTAQAEPAMFTTNDAYTDILLDLLRVEEVDTAPPHGLAFNTHTGEITTQNKPEQLEIFRQVIEQLNRPDGQCELPLRNNFRRKSVLIEARIYRMPADGFQNIVSGLQFYRGDRGSDAWWSVSPEKFKQFVGGLELSGLQLIQRPRIQTGSGMTASFYIGDGANSVEFDCKPFAADGSVELTLQSTVISGRPANTFTNHFGIKAAAEEHGGIVVRVENFNGDAGSNLVAVIGVQIVTNNPSSHSQQGLAPADETNVVSISTDPESEVTTTSDRGVNLIRTNNISASFSHTVSESSNQINMGFRLNHPIQQDELEKKLLATGVETPTTVLFYRDHGILVARGSAEQLALVNRLVLKLNGYSPKEIEARDDYFPSQINKMEFENSKASLTTNLYSRHFRVDPNNFMAALRNASGIKSNSVPAMARDFFKTLGVNLDPTTPGGLGKSLFYGDRLGELFVRATAQDLDTIENALEVLNQSRPQIHIKARFLEVPKEALALLRPFPELTNGVTVLSAFASRRLLQTLESTPGTQFLAEPEVVTTSGRQTQVRATILNFVVQETATNAAIVPQMEQVENGPSVDIIPFVLSDGYTIDLQTTALLREFFGYDDPTNSNVAYNSKGEKIDLPRILPKFRNQQASAHVELRDGQTVVLGKFTGHFLVGRDEPLSLTDKILRTTTNRQIDAKDKEALVFITATIVDPAGNRVHSDEAVPGYYDDVTPGNTQ